MMNATVKGSKEYIEKYFPIVRASELSVEDEFFKHIPKTYNQRLLRDWIYEAIKFGMSDFRVQRIDPSIGPNGKICFSEGQKPAVGISAKKWKELAEEFMPDQGSRLGTFNERVAFLAVLIKKLIVNGYSIEKAWAIVCDDSSQLGNYKQLFKTNLENTANNPVLDWYDLSNTNKVIIYDNNYRYTPSFYSCGGNYRDSGKKEQLYVIDKIWKYLDELDKGVGWIVLTKSE